MENKVSVFLPMRKGSERVVNKNTKKFSNFNGGLTELKIRQLLKNELINEIVISTDDERVIEIASSFLKIDKRIKIVERPKFLCLNDTNLKDLIEYVPSVCNFDIILWTHVTSPFFNKYDEAIKIYIENIEKFDSLMGVKEIKGFFWSCKEYKILNTFNNEWPKTQDINPMIEINNTLFINKKSNYIKYKNRIGSNPYLYINSNIESIDIDYNYDFELADFISSRYLDKIIKIEDYNKLQKEENENQIAIDFDGVIHKSSKGFYDGTIYDEPIEGAIESIKRIYESGYTIVIFTAKTKSDRPLVNGKTGSELVWDWLKKYNIDKYIKEVTSEKPRALYYIDDRGVRFENWNKTNEFLFNSK